MGYGDRSSVYSYINSPLAYGISYEPRRVNPIMYAHVRSRPNNCLAVSRGAPFTLQALLCAAAGCLISNGQMFDVVAKNFKVAITAMKVYIYVGAIAEVWTRFGTHVGYEYSSVGWTKIAGERCKIVHR